MGNYADGASFMTSAGMEYGDYVWISQDSFTLTAAVAVSRAERVIGEDFERLVTGLSASFCGDQSSQQLNSGSNDFASDSKIFHILATCNIEYILSRTYLRNSKTARLLYEYVV